MFQLSSYKFYRFNETNERPDYFSSQSFRTNFSQNHQNTNKSYYNNVKASNMYNSNQFDYKAFSPNLSSGKSQFDPLEPFPFKEIISLDFEKIIMAGKISLIEKYFPKMRFQKFKSSANPNLALLLSSFQNLLNYLFSLHDKAIYSNNQIEELINDKNSDLNKKKTKIENKIEDTKHEILSNSLKVKTLQNKIKKYKTVLYSTGNQNLIPNDFAPLDIHDDNGIFYCEICPYRKFRSYEKVHAHYVKHHLNLDRMKYQSQRNFNFEKYYFESKLNFIKDELKSTLININTDRKDDLDNKKFEDLKAHFTNLIQMYNDANNLKQMSIAKSQVGNTNTSIKLMHSNTGGEQNEQINSLLKSIQLKQDEQFQKFQNDFEDFKYEILNQLMNISQGKKIVIQSSALNKRRTQQSTNIKETHMIIEDRSQSINKKNEYFLRNNQKGSNLNKLKSENDINFEQSQNESDNKAVQHQNEEEYEKEFQDGQQVDIKSNLFNDPNKASDHFPIYSHNENNLDFPSAINNTINLGKSENDKSDKVNPFENLKRHYYLRDKSVLFNDDHYETPQQKATAYNFIPVQLTKKAKDQIAQLVESKANSYDFTLDNRVNLMSKDYYANIIRKIFQENDELSKKIKKYAEYKDNVYSMNKIKESLDYYGKEIKDIVYQEAPSKQVSNFIDENKGMKDEFE